jgi:hypothetical protein
VGLALCICTQIRLIFITSVITTTPPASVSAVDTADDIAPAELAALLLTAAAAALARCAAAMADGATSRDVALSRVRALRYCDMVRANLEAAWQQHEQQQQWQTKC